MDAEIRTIAEDEFEAYCRALETAFSGTLTEEDLRIERLIAEPDRRHAAFEDGGIVGGAAAVSLRITLPGGAALPVAGITGVGVLPSHRRRGINAELMRRQLDDVHDRGEPLAALWASEGGIYGRFGYGLASLFGELDVETARTAFVRGYRPEGRVRLLGRVDALPRMRPVYERVRSTRPGMIELDDRWFDWRFTERERDKDQPWFYALHETEAGEADAYVVYQVKHEWPDSLPKLQLNVRELLALTPQGYADIWRFVFDVDLVHKVNAWNRPVDEPLLRLLAEPRQLRFRLGDAMWVRLVDVAAALTARAYSVDGRVVLDVEDRFCPWNEGRYELVSDRGSGSCEPTDDEPDINCTVNDLGAVYLGGATFRQLHRAGLTREREPGALARADAMFASDPAPWCSFMF